MEARGRCVLRHAAVVVACVALMIVAGVEGEADGAEMVARMADQELAWGCLKSDPKVGA